MHLNLPALGHINSHFDEQQLIKVIQEMKHLQVLNVHCYHSLQPYLNLKVKLEELTIHMKTLFKKDFEVFENWTTNGFIPPNLNIVLSFSCFIWNELRDFLFYAWPKWNSQIPAGHIAYLKLYIDYKVPLNLFQNAPVFQLQYGQPVTLPFVHVNNIGVNDEWLLLTDHDDGSKVVRKAKVSIYPSDVMYRIIHDNNGLDNQLDCRVSNLTELDSDYNLDFKQLMVACPQLQRLNLCRNKKLRLEDLQVIATCCPDLQGLNLGELPIPDSKFCVKVWELLSTMKLIFLTVDMSFFERDKCRKDNINEQLVTLFKQFTTLKALELLHNARNLHHPGITTDYELLSNFPSLEYCRITRTKQSTCPQSILTTCKKLKYFYCSCFSIKQPSQLPVQPSLLPVHNNL